MFSDEFKRFSDITKKPIIRTMHDEDAACLGAAILAGKAAGIFARIEDAVQNMVAMKERFEPDAKRFGLYDELYVKYVKLYESLQNLFEIT